ncbi:MAG TPA: SBBP repeat-containing protein, partial [Blastocatellia bacterium]|nr:SBBP repeat-containing protein [Blastocatellia bacterium]
AVTTDLDGNVYLVGTTASPDFPAVNSLQEKQSGFTDAFVAKFSAAGELIFSTYLGGSGNEQGRGIAVDSSGGIYLTGSTNSLDFPTLNAFQGGCNSFFGLCLGRAFVTRLSADGSQILYSTYLGGSGPDSGSAITVDRAGHAYVVGETFSSNFPTRKAWQPRSGGGPDLFIARLDPAAGGPESLIFSTYFGGSGVESAQGIALSGTGEIYLTGSTTSSDLPTLNPVQATNRGAGDLLVASLTANGDSLVFSTYLGGSDQDDGTGLTVDGAGNAYVTGTTRSNDFPTRNAFMSLFNGGESDAVAVKFGPGGELSYSTFLGSDGRDSGRGVAVDDFGQASFAGTTDSNKFPVLNSIQSYSGQEDVFILQLNATGETLLFSTYLGGATSDVDTGLALDRGGNLLVTGVTDTVDFPTLNATQPAFGGGLFDAFVTKIAISIISGDDPQPDPPNQAGAGRGI